MPNKKKDGRSLTSALNGKKGGRKPGLASVEAEKARDLICIKLRENFGPIIDKAIEQAKEGDHNARVWLSERGYGKVKQDFGVGDVGDLVDDEKRKNSQLVIARLLGVIVDSE